MMQRSAMLSRLLVTPFFAAIAAANSAVLSNLALPLDTTGNLLLTGEATVLFASPYYYMYMNNWGGCAGVDCCTSVSGCASCCFNPPSKQFPDPCVYTANHSVVAYRTTDFTKFEYRGVALPLSSRRVGTEFRPQVVYSPLLSLYVMWYEDRWSGQDGYAVATAPTADGPFVTLYNSTKMSGPGRIGDYDIFVDDDGSAYHVRTGVTIEKLNADFTAASGESATFSNGGVEGPAMFKRNEMYYILVGVGCCACRGGSNVEVYTASAPLGPYTLQGDVGKNTSQAFAPYSPTNYATHAQQSKVFTVPAADGSLQYVWMGNQWVTSTQPGRPRNHDLLFWTVLEFDAAGVIQQINWQDSTTLSLP